MPPELSSGGENAHLIRLILAATLSSNYGLYGPVYEFGLNRPVDGKEEYIDNEKYEIRNWDWEAETKIGDVITLVNGIRKANPALHTTMNIKFMQTTNDRIICFTKASADLNNVLIVVVNLDPSATQSGWVDVPLPDNLTIERRYGVDDLLSGDKYQWVSGWNYVALNPWDMPAHIMKVIMHS